MPAAPRLAALLLGPLMVIGLLLGLASPAGAQTDPLALTAPDDQSYTVGTVITALELPEATGGIGDLSYTLTGPNNTDLSEVPGLTFNADTRKLSGTPGTAASATTLTYTVTDSAATPVVATQDFTVTVAAATLSADSTLSALDVSAGTLNPPFDAATDAYAVSVGTDVASVTVTPTTTDDGAAVAVNGVAVASGQPSEAIDLDVGNNIITILVVAEDGTGEQTYTVTVARAVPPPGIDLGRDTARDGGTNMDRITSDRSIVVTLHADFQNARDTWEWSSNSGELYTTGSNTGSNTGSFSLAAAHATYQNNVVGARQTVNGVVSEFAGLARFRHDTVKPVISLNGGGTSVTITNGDAYNDPVTVDDDFPIDPSKIVITGAIDVDTAGEYTLTYNVMDTAGNPADPLTRTVTVSEPVPPLALPFLPELNFTRGTAVDVTLPEATGGIGDLAYTLTAFFGLPAGLTFDAASRTLSGTPTADRGRRYYDVFYTVTDANGATLSANFFIVVAAAPRLGLPDLPPPQFYTAGTPITPLTLPEATNGTGPWSYTLTGQFGRDLPPGLSFDANTRTLSGTPTASYDGDLTYRVTDATDNFAADFSVTVAAAPPLALSAVANQGYTVDAAVNLVLPAATGGVGPWIYTLTGPGGTTLPVGLDFNTDTRTLSGMPTAAGGTVLTYTVTDSAATPVVATQTFTVTVNDGLALSAPGAQSYTVGTAVDVTLPLATGGIGDLSYTLTDALPAGLNFNPASRRLTGTPSTMTSATTLTYTVTDANGATAMADFTVTVNAGLVLTTAGAQGYTAGTAITDLTLPPATGGTAPLTYALTGPADTTLPAGLAFTAVIRTLSGTPTGAATTELTYTVTDANGATATADFTVTVNARPGLPELPQPSTKRYTAGTPITALVLPEATDGTAPLVYTLTRRYGLTGALPPGLSFDANTRTLSGTPTGAVHSSSSIELTYTVTDDNGATARQFFTVDVSPPLPLVLTAPDDQGYTAGRPTDLELPAATGGVGPWIYTLTGPEGAALPDGLTFTVGTRTLSGTPGTAASATELTYTVTDANGTTARQFFTVNVNAGLVVLPELDDQFYTVGTRITDLVLPTTTGGTGDLTYALTGALPNGLTFTVGTRTLSGTPGTAASATELTYTVTDANDATAVRTFTVTVNAGLALTTAGDQFYTVNTPITDLELPTTTGGTAPLRYTLTGPEGAALPAGLRFDKESRTLSGLSTVAGATTLTYTVTDANDATATADFTVTVNTGLVVTELDDRYDQFYTVDTEITELTLPVAGGGTAPLRYTLTGPGDTALPAGLTFTAASRKLSGTPTVAATTELTYRVTDANGASTRRTFTVTVNDGLVLTTAGDQSYTAGTAIVGLVLPEATGGTGPLRYALTGPGDTALPAGLTFTAASRTLSGTPTEAAITTLTYTVTDANDATATADFTVTVTAPNTAPVIGTAAAAVDHAENTPVATAVATYTATDAEGDTVTWTLGGNDAGDFSIDPNGALTFKTLRDFETPGSAATSNTYFVTITATDDGGSNESDTLDVAVTVTNVDDEDGVVAIAITRDGTTVSGAPRVGDTLTASVTDADSGSAAVTGTTWQWQSDSAGTYTDISGATAAAYSPVADDVDSTLQAVATYNDSTGSGKIATSDPTATVTAAPPGAPTGLTARPGDATVTLAWTAPGATGGADITGYEYRQSDATGDYDTTGSAAVVDWMAIPNSATATEYTVAGLTNDTAYFFEVRAVNSGGKGEASDEATATPTATNTAPVIGNADAAVDHAENTPVATAVATYTATDAEGDTVTWTLGGNDAGDFSIDPNGALTFKTLRDFETPGSVATSNTYFVTITATDDGGSNESDTLDVTVTVTNVDDEDGVVAIAITRDGTTVPGAPRVGDTLTASVTDADSGSAAVTGTTWQWQSSSAGSTTDISGATAAAYSPVADDVDRTLQAVATYNDSTASGKTATSAPTATVTAAPPSAPTGLTAEAGDATVTLAWAAPSETGGAAITGYEYRVKAGTGEYGAWIAATTSPFAVTGLTNDTAYSFQVRAVNSVGGGEASDATATPTAPNTAPVIDTADAAVDHAENTPVATAVATYTATDAEGDTVTWTLGGNDAGDFSIDSNGALTFDTEPDFETPGSGATSNTYSVTITATDDGGPNKSDTLDVTVTVTNVDDEGGVVAITRDGTTVPGAPRVGDTLTASVTDADSGSAAVTDTTWRWQSGSAGTYTDISGATAAAYSPVAGDVDSTLRAVATYNDSTGSGKTATSAPTAPVVAAGTIAAPSVTAQALTTGNANAGYAKAGDTLTLTFTVSKALSATPTATIAGQTAPVTPTTNANEYTATYTVAAADVQGAATYDIGNLVSTDAGADFDPGEQTSAIVIDTIAPTVSDFNISGSLTAGRQATGDIEFSEPVTGVDAADFSATNAAIDSVTASVDATTYTIAYTPVMAAEVTLSFAANGATDTAGNTGPATATEASETARPPAPLALPAPPDQSYTVGTTITELILPEATGGTGDLTYTLTGLAGGALPAGLSFDTAPRRLTGTPGTVATTTLTYTVTDANGATATADFTVTVALPRFADLNRTILPEVARAIAGHTVGAIARRVTQARADGVTDSAGSFNLGGQTTVAGVAGALASHGQAMADGTLSLKDLLGGGDFVLPLNARAAAGAPGLSSLAFWGAGDYSNLDGSGGAVDWDGDLFSAHLGADARLRDDLLVGLAVSWSRVDLDYSDPDRSGDYELDLTSFHPYVGWSALSGKLDLWATVGYGWGDLEIANEAQQASSDVEMRTVAVGGLGRLLKVGATTLRLKGDALLTEMEVEGSDEMAALTVDARRVRMILEGSRTHTLADGAQLEPSLEVGVRHDGGDGETGFGAELGGGVRYSNPVMGLTLEGRARTLVGRDSYGEWGVNGLIRLERGNGRGLSFNLSPGYGKTGSGTQRLWQQGLHDKIDGERDYGARMDLRLGYGLPAFGGRGLLTPYSEVTFGDSARNYRLGMEWELGALFELNLTGERHESSDGAADHAIMLKGEVRF